MGKYIKMLVFFAVIMAQLSADRERSTFTNMDDEQNRNNGTSKISSIGPTDSESILKPTVLRTKHKKDGKDKKDKKDNKNKKDKKNQKDKKSKKNKSVMSKNATKGHGTQANLGKKIETDKDPVRKLKKELKRAKKNQKEKNKNIEDTQKKDLIIKGRKAKTKEERKEFEKQVAAIYSTQPTAEVQDIENQLVTLKKRIN